ncbi:MAG: DnaA regulatory inactivator Hda [Xanthomonadaceae bacterium]|nr:DnaA regulatory inactivator Hda [Xanthomonadaceae bacterium]
MGVQLPLGVGLTDGAVFATFHAGPNAAAVQAVRDAAAGRGEPVVFLHGAAGAGRTHLLQAACVEAEQAGRRAALLPLHRCAALPPQVIENWEQYDLVCIDDVDGIAGDAGWERALFVLFNALRARGGCWLAAGANVPGALGLTLPDLASRLAAGPVFRLQPLDDDGRLAALALRARRRGLELPDEVGRYLLKHAPRDMVSLYGLLERLDHASLSQQRRLTIPLVKEILNA